MWVSVHIFYARIEIVVYSREWCDDTQHLKTRSISFKPKTGSVVHKRKRIKYVYPLSWVRAQKICCHFLDKSIFNIFPGIWYIYVRRERETERELSNNSIFSLRMSSLDLLWYFINFNFGKRLTTKAPAPLLTPAEYSNPIHSLIREKKNRNGANKMIFLFLRSDLRITAAVAYMPNV